MTIVRRIAYWIWCYTHQKNSPWRIMFKTGSCYENCRLKEVIKKCPCVQFVVNHLTWNNYINVPIAKDMNVQLVQLMHMIRSFIVPIVVKIYNCKLEITEEPNRSFSLLFYPPQNPHGLVLYLQKLFNNLRTL